MGATPELKSDEVTDELADALAGKTGEETVVEDEPEPEPAKETSKEEKGEEKTEEKPEEKAEEKDPLFDINEQNRELRQLLRSQKREMSILKAKLERVEKRSVEATKKVEEDEETLFGEKKAPEKTAEPADDFSPVEMLQTELAQIAKVKGPVLETLLEVMEASPAYPDVREVCGQANFDDIFEAIGDAVAAKEGKDASLAALEAEAAVWKMPNPYKYMYGLIKQYHPKYVARQRDAKESAVVKPKEPAKKSVEAPSSIADKSGKSAPTNAWTAARIDELDEMELNKVPADIYDKYLRGELD